MENRGWGTYYADNKDSAVENAMYASPHFEKGSKIKKFSNENDRVYFTKPREIVSEYQCSKYDYIAFALGSFVGLDVRSESTTPLWEESGWPV